MEIMERSCLMAKVRELRGRRERHERIIDTLVGDREAVERSRDSYAIDLEIGEGKIDTERSRVGQQGNENVITQRSNISSVSRISQQVNLDIYLSKQPQTCQKPAQKPQQGQLLSSLVHKYGNKQLKIMPSKQLRQNSTILSQKSLDFSLVAAYIHENELWEEIFERRDGEYYAYVCAEFYGKGDGLVCLSGDGLGEAEAGLVVDQAVHYTEESESDGSGSDREVAGVCIGYLLLYRLLGEIGTGYAPHILQTILGYPFSTHNLHSTKSYLQLLSSPHPDPRNNQLLLARSTLNQKLSQLPPQKLKQPDIVDRYSEVVVVSTVKALCCRTVEIVQRRNHHSVVDLEWMGEGELMVYCCFVGGGEGYRYCLIGEEGQIVQYSQPTHNERESFTLTLSPSHPYKLYLSQSPSPSSPLLPSFTLILQSPESLSPLQTSIKFNESYNTMTQTLINRYLTDYADIDQVEREMIRLSHLQGEKELLVVRVGLGLMGLGVDFVAVQDGAGRRRERVIEIEYEDKEVLCDRHYKDNKKRLTITNPQIHQIPLSKPSKILSTSSLPFSFSQLSL